jgi:hypothetical protein
MCPKISSQKRSESFKYYTLLKNIVFWDVAPSGFGLNRRFGGTYTPIFRTGGGDRFLRNVGSNQSQAVLHPRRRYSS